MLTRRKFLELSATAATAAGMGAGCNLGISSVPDQASHRPWPLPQTPWRMFMRWHDLLFLHWPIRPELIRPMLHRGVVLETFDGWAWIGIVPFHMSGVRPRYVPLPLAFPELNVRTYVNSRGRSGVWFFSLDAASWIAVRVARWFGLPYYDARMTVRLDGDVIHYQSVRSEQRASSAEFNVSYKPTGAVYHASPGTLDHWLTERYCLYAARKPDQVVYGEIHHSPWPLQPAELELRVNTMTEPIAVELPNTQPLSHFARYQEVVAWPIVRLDTK